ncbi:receptor activity-modifying protein 1 [Arapaima gigas]
MESHRPALRSGSCPAKLAPGDAMGSAGTSAPPRPLSVWLAVALWAACSWFPAAACGSAYQDAIEDFCLTKFRLDMEGLDRHDWCSWEDTVETYGELTNCTYMIALKMDCFWPNRLVDEFFIDIHRHYFHNCALSGRLLRDPPNRILGPFIVVPILVTLLMTALVVWRSKRSEGIV